MAKIAQNLSFTYKLGDPKLNQFVKVGIEISEINDELPIEPQLKNTENALDQIWQFILEKVNLEVTRLNAIVEDGEPVQIDKDAA